MLSACTLKMRWAADGEVGHDWSQFRHDTEKAGYRGFEILEYLQTREGGEMMCSPWGAATIRAKTPEKSAVEAKTRKEPTPVPSGDTEANRGPTLGPPYEETERRPLEGIEGRPSTSR